MKRFEWRLGLSILLITALTACGKYSAPVAPEAASPRGVEYLEAKASPDGVNFAWQSPDKDQRGKELAQIDGYRVYRQTLEHETDLIEPESDYDLLAEIPDTHLQILSELREQAEATGKVTRKVKVADELKQFAYLDSTPQAGQTYAYKIVPINQGSVEGEVLRLVRVKFQGDRSLVTVFDNTGAIAARPDKADTDELIDAEAETTTEVP